MTESVRPAISKLPLTCSHWGTYRVEAHGGKVVAMHDFEGDPDPSPIGRSFVDVLDHPARITSPVVRRSWLENGPGPRNRAIGAEPFVRVSWDTAEQLVADELDRIRSEFGNQAIFGGSYGWASAGRFHHAQSQLHRFLNCIGGYTRSVNSYSLAAAEVAMPHIMAPFHKLLDQTTSWPAIAGNCELFVAFGGVPVRNSQINAGGAASHCQREGLLEAHRSGTAFVNVSPIRNDLLQELDAEWVAPVPGTDVAMILGICHTIHSEELCNRDFIRNCTVGYEEFVDYLEGNSDGVVKSADWASLICRIEADCIRNLARRMASKRTMISVAWSLTRQDHGEQPFWAATTLAAMLGQIGLPGGGIGFGYGAVNSVGDHITVIPAASFPQGENPVKDFIPVSRISDMLLNPRAKFDYDGGKYRFPEVRLVYWAGGNPFHHHQDLNRLVRAWSKPDTVVVHDWVWTATASQADIVLPCTASVERNDIAISRSPFVVYMNRVVPPPPETRNDFEILSRIAGRMGVEDAFTEGRNEEEWLEWMYGKTRDRMRRRGIDLPDLNQLRQQGWHRVEPPGKPNILLEEFRSDPEQHPLPTPSGKIEIFSETVAEFAYDDCPGHAAWMEPVEWLGATNGGASLHLLSNQPAGKLHSQLDHGSVSRATKAGGREVISIHPADALARGIADADPVRVANSRGACLATARLDEGVREGVVLMSTGSWFDPGEHEGNELCKHGNPNVLTIDKGTSRLAQGPIAHTCLVEVQRLESEPPDVTAHSPPEVL